MRYGLIVHLQLLSTPPRGDAVTFGYRVPEHSDRDFHPADSMQLQAHSGGCPRINPNSSNDLRISPPGTKCGIPRKTKNRSAAARRKSLSTFTCFSDRLLGQAFQPDSEPCQAGEPDLLPWRGNISPRGTSWEPFGPRVGEACRAGKGGKQGVSARPTSEGRGTNAARRG